jgi:hypothetical protein
MREGNCRDLPQIEWCRDSCEVNLNGLFTHKAPTPACPTTLAILAHRRSYVLSKALWTESTLRVRFHIPERSAELVIVALEAQLLSKVSVLIFQFRGSLLQLAQLVYDLINLVSGLSILPSVRFPDYRRPSAFAG